MSYASPRMLKKAFDEATQQVLNEKWPDFYYFSFKPVLPSPDLSTLPQLPAYSMGMRVVAGHSGPTIREQQLTWEAWATKFINSYRKRIDQKLRDITPHLTAEIEAWNQEKSTNKQLSVDRMYQEWLDTTQHLSLAEFIQLPIGPDTARQFLTPKFEVIKERYGMYEGHKPKKKTEKRLTIQFADDTARLSLVESLKHFVQSNRHSDLLNLINGEPVVVPITCSCQQVRLGELFYEFVKEQDTRDRKIQTSKKQLAKWICQNIHCTKEGQVVAINELVMLRYLSGHGFAQCR